MIIFAVKHIKTGFSVQDSDILSKLIDSALADGAENIVIDFTDVEKYCTAFFSFSLTHRLKYMTREEYDKRFRLTGLSELGKGAYHLAYDGAVQHYGLPLKKRLELEKELEELIQEYLY